MLFQVSGPDIIARKIKHIRIVGPLEGAKQLGFEGCFEGWIYGIRFMLFDFATVGVFLGLALFFVLAALITSRLIQPVNPYPKKNTTYECGESPIGSSWIRFNNRFYIIALIFLIFDVEIVFIFPCVAIFREFLRNSSSLLIMIEILVFILILISGLAYVWVKGDLDWIKSTQLSPIDENEKPEGEEK
jgi:NADH-quinone oxidoreductase subunit A